MRREAILLDKPENFNKMGINPNEVEEWEDGIRDNSEPNHFEWWYFDSILDDGTKVVIQFLSKNGRTFTSKKFHPSPQNDCKEKRSRISIVKLSIFFVKFLFFRNSDHSATAINAVR